MKHIRVIATANTMADLTPALREIGEARMRSLGFTVSYADHADAKLFHTAGSLSDRIKDFHAAATHPQVDVILSVFGGYNSNQLLDEIDYSQVIASGKPVIGYSDFSAILNALAAKGSTTSYHGPSFASFCDPAMEPFAHDNFARVLAGESVTYKCPGSFANDLWFLKAGYGPREPHECKEWRVYRAGEARGLIFGGNLETLCKLVGTPYLPDLTDSILFIEDVSGNNPGAFHRELTQLRQAGVFDKIRGLIIGKFPFGSKLDNFEQLSYVLDDVLRGKHMPVLCDVFCSHVDPMMTIPLGRHAHMNAGAAASVTVNLQP